MGSQTDLKCKVINDFISKFWDIYWLNIDSTYTQNTQQHVFKQIIVFITRSAFPSSGKIIILPLARLELNRPPPNSYLTDHRACLSSCIGMVDGMANPVSIDVLSHWWSAGNKLENYGDWVIGLLYPDPFRGFLLCILQCHLIPQLMAGSLFTEKGPNLFFSELIVSLCINVQ